MPHVTLRIFGISEDAQDVSRPWQAVKPHKMMQLDLEAARKAWLKEAKTDEDKLEREKTG